MKHTAAVDVVEEFVSEDLIPLENAMHGQSLPKAALEYIARKAERPQLNVCRLVVARPDRLSHVSLVLLAEQLGRTNLKLVELAFGPIVPPEGVVWNAGNCNPKTRETADRELIAGDHALIRTMGFALGTAQRLLSDCSSLGRFNISLCARKVSEIAADALAARTLVISMAKTFDEKSADPEQFAPIRLFVGEALERCVDKSLEIFSIARSLGAVTPPTWGHRSPIRGADMAADSAVIAGRLFNPVGRVPSIAAVGAR